MRWERNELTGSDKRREFSGQDYDQLLRELVEHHMDTFSRTARDVALSVRMDVSDFEAWLSGDQPGTLDMLSAICALTNSQPNDLFIHAESHVHLDSIRRRLVSRLVAGLSDDEVRFGIAIAEMLVQVPATREVFNQSLRVSTEMAERLGYDVDLVVRKLRELEADVSQIA